jgi:hypothetical protein
MTILTNAEPVTKRKLKGRAPRAVTHSTKITSFDRRPFAGPYRERMSAEQYQKLMRNVKTTKQRAAREVIAQYVAKNEEEHHA